MAGTLDSLLKDAAKSVVTDLGKALDRKITYRRRVQGTYNKADGSINYTVTTYSDVYAPIEEIVTTSDSGKQINRANLYLTPSLIGNNQPTLKDEVTLTYEGATKIARIEEIKTYGGGQNYLYILSLHF